MIQSAFEYAKNTLSQQYPDADMKAIEESFNEGLVAQAEQYN